MSIPSDTYHKGPFLECYKEEIGYILSLIKKRCKDQGYKIKEEEKLFKNLIDIIYKYSDRSKLKYE